MKKTMTIIAAAALLAFYAQAAGNFVHEDGTVAYLNSGAAISSGELIDLGERYGVALVDIASNATGTVATRGIFSLARGVTSAVSQGAKMYYNSATAVDTTYTADEYVGLCAEGVSVCTALTNSLGQVDKYVWVDLNAPQIDYTGAFTGQAPSAHTPTITITVQGTTGYDSTGAAITNAAGATLSWITNVTAASSALPLFLTNGTITVYP